MDSLTKARRYIANRLMSLALWVDPGNPHAMRFYMDRMIDFVLSGRSNIKITVVPDEEVIKHG